MKRGMSSIVTTVLIVLLIIASVSIIWTFLFPVVNDNLDVLNEQVDLSIVSNEGYTSWDENSRLVSVQVKRGTDEADVIGFGLIFTMGGDSVVHYVGDILAVNSKKVYYVNLSNYSGELDSMKLVPVFWGGKIGEVISEINYGNVKETELDSLNPEGGFSAPVSSVPGGGGSSSTVTPVVDPVVDDENESVENETNCTEDWSCGGWSSCVVGTQTRTCVDLNDCGTEENKSDESQGCVVVSGNWEAPIGIPVPEFGIEESYRMYDNVSNRNPALTYVENSEGGFYTHYVDN